MRGGKEVCNGSAPLPAGLPSPSPSVTPLPEGEALAVRKASPRRQRLPYSGQRRRPPPAAEAGRSCWGSGQRDASGREADAGSRNLALSNEVRLRGCTKTEPFLCREVRLVASIPVSFCRSLCYTCPAALPAHFIGKGGEAQWSLFLPLSCPSQRM